MNEQRSQRLRQEVAAALRHQLAAFEAEQMREVIAEVRARYGPLRSPASSLTTDDWARARLRAARPAERAARAELLAAARDLQRTRRQQAAGHAIAFVGGVALALVNVVLALLFVVIVFGVVYGHGRGELPQPRRAEVRLADAHDAHDAALRALVEAEAAAPPDALLTYDGGPR